MKKYNNDIYEMKNSIESGKVAQATQALPHLLEDLKGQISVQNEILQNEIDQKNKYDRRSKILVIVAIITSLASTIANIIVLLLR